MIYSIVEIKNIISSKQYVVYGAGYVARRFLRYLKRENLTKNIQSVAITSDEPDDLFYGYEVQCIDSISRESLIIVAAYAETSIEMIEHLKSRGFSNYIRLSDYILMLEFGEPIRKSQIISVSQTIEKMPPFYNQVITHLAIDNYYGKNQCGFSLYVKMMASFTNIQTAEKRLDSFKKKIHDYSLDRENDDYNIIISDDGRFIIDGMHRLALAYYFGLNSIKADICKCDEELFHSVFIESTLDELTLKSRFSVREISIIKDSYKTMVNQ